MTCTPPAIAMSQLPVWIDSMARCMATNELEQAVSMGALGLVLGAIATARGLSLAVDIGAAAIILMNVATLVLATATPTISPSATGPAST